MNSSVMMKGASALRRAAPAWLVLATLIAGPAAAATVNVDFADQTASFVTPVANPLDYAVASFSSANGLRVFTFGGGFPLDKGLCAHATNACRSALTIDLSANVTSLSFDVFQVDERDSVLSVAATSLGGVQASTLSLTKGWNVNRLTLSDLAGVTRLVLDGTSDEEGVIYDNFSFETAASTTGGVPEPATWALMISGLGLAGGVLRRRRRQVGLV